MSSITYVSSILLLLVILSSLFIFVRSASLPISRRHSPFGWLALALYLCCVLGGLVLWGQDAEGIGIAALLLGMPWSALSAFVLSGLLHVRTGLFGTTWATTVTLLSFGAIGVNCLLVYQLGQRLPALWSRQRQSSKRAG